MNMLRFKEVENLGIFFWEGNKLSLTLASDKEYNFFKYVDQESRVNPLLKRVNGAGN